MSFKFEVIHVCKQSGARLGKLTTPHGVFETPIFYAGWHTSNC